MYIALTVILLLVLVTLYILNLPVFGKLPSGERLEKIKKQLLYADGALYNQSPTPMLPPDVSYWEMFKKMIKGNENGAPKKTLPHVKPDFNRSKEFKITWFGHSSYLIQVDELNILVDPVFSKRPSPFQFIGTKRFEGTDFVNPIDLPNLDIVLITHDHYDHLDYHAILKLKEKTKYFITSLGVGAHLTYWGIPEQQITELAWQEQTSPIEGINFKALPARHFSGRKFKRNQTLWSSFILKTKNHQVYLGGDSGYDQHFKKIGETYGPFDLAILECGQYNKMWPLIHLFPEEVVEAGLDLKAKQLLPVHWGKYKLALHDWDEPIKRLVNAASGKEIKVKTPLLGESFYLDKNQATTSWWINF
jgi:L-ascorbate metabolism protein UlaG (beta-lactamase superfamily)